MSDFKVGMVVNVKANPFSGPEHTAIILREDMGGWRCDDGWTHEEHALKEATSEDAAIHKAILRQDLSLINDFEAWLKNKPD